MIFNPNIPTSPKKTNSNSYFKIIKNINISNLHTKKSDKIKNIKKKNLTLLTNTKIPKNTDPLAHFSKPTKYNNQTHPPIKNQTYNSKNNFKLLTTNTPKNKHILLLQNPKTPKHIILNYPKQSYIQNTKSLNYTNINIHTKNTPKNNSKHDTYHKFLSSLKPPSDNFLNSLTIYNNKTKRTKIIPQQNLALPSKKITNSNFSIILKSNTQLKSKIKT